MRTFVLVCQQRLGTIIVNAGDDEAEMVVMVRVAADCGHGIVVSIEGVQFAPLPVAKIGLLTCTPVRCGCSPNGRD